MLLLLVALTVAVAMVEMVVVVVVFRCVAENTKCEQEKESEKFVYTQYMARIGKDEEN